jgi:hypothetical protein
MMDDLQWVISRLNLASHDLGIRRRSDVTPDFPLSELYDLPFTATFHWPQGVDGHIGWLHYLTVQQKKGGQDCLKKYNCVTAQLGKKNTQHNRYYSHVPMY